MCGTKWGTKGGTKCANQFSEKLIDTGFTCGKLITMKTPNIKPFEAMEKFAVIEIYREHVPGDERSKTNPGHGYPAHTVEHKTIRNFANREEWEAWIKDALAPKYGQPKEFTPIVYRVANIERSITIKID